MVKKLHLYSFFHLNLAYSAIEEEQRPLVVERCYWPLLRLVASHDLPFGVELSGYTLEAIAGIDPAWVAELGRLVQLGRCELIGCGYAQLIGPLVPAEVNAANLRLGMEAYERLLGVRPDLALINEQAYAAGLVPLYRDEGFSGLIMEWNNPARGNPEWAAEWRYLPHHACGLDGESLPLIWNHSIAFQKFQRYAHGELALDEYLSYLHSHVADGVRAFPVYGNDVEVFDFRPGRYMTEEPLHSDGEWRRIEQLYEALKMNGQVELVPASRILQLLDQPSAGQYLHLQSAAQPTPVKKQDKYNLLRWAVTGRDDLSINTRCWQIYAGLRENPDAGDVDWRELCYLWSSDFRTHITEQRWTAYLKRLKDFADRWAASATTQTFDPLEQKQERMAGTQERRSFQIARHGRFLQINGKRLLLRLNCHRGLALDAMVDRQFGDKPLCGTLPHGYFDDIQWGADYYTGHLVFHSPGRAKVTDLSPVEPQVVELADGLHISAIVSTQLGPITKEWLIDDKNGCVRLRYQLDWPDAGIGSLRLGHITLMPEAFDPRTLVYRTHNGGRSLETFPLGNADFDHGQAVSFLISANQAVGMTQGVFEFADQRHCLCVETDPTIAALVGLVTHSKVGEQHFTRLALSVREVDDTSREAPISPIEFEIRIFASTPADHETP